LRARSSLDVSSDTESTRDAAKPRSAATAPPLPPEQVQSDAETEPQMPGRGGAQHKRMQSLIRKLGEDRGFAVSTEVTVLDGHGYVDAVLEGYGLRVGFEISVSARL